MAKKKEPEKNNGKPKENLWSDRILAPSQDKEEFVMSPSNIDVKGQIWRLTFAMLEAEDNTRIIVNKINELEQEMKRNRDMISQLIRLGEQRNLPLATRLGIWYAKIFKKTNDKK